MSCCPHGSQALSSKAPTAATAPGTASAVPPASATKKSTTSFYRRPLPDSCVALSSEDGQKRFASALESQGLKSFFRLIEQFTTQSEPAFCGISTLVIILNALAVDPRQSWKGPWRFYEESMLNCGLNLEEVKQTGITIVAFRCLAICQGLTVTMVRADDDEDAEVGLQKFRQAVQQACVKSDQNQLRPDELLVASYSRKVLGQTGSGHFSPIAAYDPESDSVLVLDTARFKYGAHWVGLPLLYDAMKPIDPDTARSRGYVLLSNHEEGNEEVASPLIPSVLFRTRTSQDAIRKEYKEFLATTTVSELEFDQVAAFWTKKDTKYIWKMMEPQLKPLSGDQSVAGLIDSVRSLMKRILSRLEHKPLPAECCQCRVNFARSLDLSPREAIFVVYLASLEEERRGEVVLQPEEGSESGAEVTQAQTQLLAEADLVRHGIDMCDVEDGN